MSNQSGKVHIRLLIGLILGISLLSWFLLRIEWPVFAKAMSGVKTNIVLLAAGILLFEFLLRTVRWKILLKPIDPNANFWDLLSATLIGAATNTLLPARAGDLAKPLVAHRKTKIPLAPIITTAIVERVFDLIGLLFVFLVMLAMLPNIEGPEGILVNNLKKYGTLMGGAGFIGLTIILIAARNRGFVFFFTNKIVNYFPKKLQEKVSPILKGFIDGLASMESIKEVLVILSVTMLLWLNGAVSIWVLFKAFQLTLPFGAAAFTAVAIALTVALPQAPGFVGVFHVAIQKTLELWGMDPSPSAGFAIVFWGISFVPVTLLGLIALWREGISIGDLLLKKK